MSRSVRFYAFGGPEVLKIEDVAIPRSRRRRDSLANKDYRAESKRNSDPVR
jgi:hypothetical protein